MDFTVTRILNEHWENGRIPIDPAQIAAKMGISVMADPLLEASGHYEPTGRHGKALIVYNPSESAVRQRFTIAHELGHHILQHGARDRDTPKNFVVGNSDPKEVSANKFAAKLLMPSDYLRSVVEVRGIHSLDTLASMFNVSRSAMAYRLKELNYAFD